MSVNNYTMNSFGKQSGATLIVVLAMVLLLGLLATIAVRGLQTSMGMTTSSQVNKLLVQSSDVPLAKLEMANIDKDSSGNTVISAMGLGEGPIGYLLQEGNQDKEYILCYRPTTVKGLYEGPNSHMIIVPNGNNTPGYQGSSSGYCDLSNASAFTSGRKAVSSQITMTRPTVNTSTSDDVDVKPLAASNLGIDGASIGVKESTYFRSYATSILPGLSLSSNSTTISNCMKLPIGGNAGTTASSNEINCLSTNNVPMNIQVQDYAYNLNTNPTTAPTTTATPSTATTP